jgi:hypothetical protein
VRNSWSSYSKETYIAALSAACILLSLTLRHRQWRSDWEIPLYIAVVLGRSLVMNLGRKLLARNSVRSARRPIGYHVSSLGQYLVGAIVVLLLSVALRWSICRAAVYRGVGHPHAH